MDCYLKIFIYLLIFFTIVIIYLRFGYAKPTYSGFTAVPVHKNYMIAEGLGTTVDQKLTNDAYDPNIYQFDTRYVYSTLPPVNPMVNYSTVLTSIPAEYDLYTTEGYHSFDGNELDVPYDPNTNQLYYSGGNTTMINIPLQMNDPFDEPLRSHTVLVTDYNKIKYGK
jgi:hypothetical protein